MKYVFPIEISVHIISQVCQGLHYAHNFTDKLTGKHADIVHRDISPHNIMISYDGAVKVIDFGIAKAETNTDATQSGTIKGKLSYLAPEYLEGRKLDHRYDQFALGITLWELLCSRKLFKAANDLAILKKIQACKIPIPSSINPNVSQELDEIVLKALSKNPEDRYENMDKFNRALVKFLYSNFADFNATDLHYFAKELFKDDIKHEREVLYTFGQIDMSPFIKELDANKSSGDYEDKTYATLTKKGVLGLDDISESKKESSDEKNRGKVDLDLGFDKGAATTIRTLGGKSSRISTSYQKRSTSKKGFSPVFEEKKKRSFISTFIFGGVILGLLSIYLFVPVAELEKIFKNVDRRIQSEKSKEMTPKDKKKGGADLTKKSKNIKSKEGSKKIKLRLKNFNRFKQALYVNGKRRKSTLLGVLDLSVEENEIVTIRVEQSNFKPFVKKIKVRPNTKSVEIRVKISEKARYAYLVMSRRCVEGTFFYKVFGETRRETLPIIGRRLSMPMNTDKKGHSVPTKHVAFYQLEGQNYKRKIRILAKQQDDEIDLCKIITETSLF
jgi:serine/threonine-protein kinase